MMPSDRETVSLFLSITLLAISSLEARADTSQPKVSYETTILHGHLYISWTIDKDILQSNLPINYSINYCPTQLNQGLNDPCQHVTTICHATYSYTGTTQNGTIKSYPDNILKYLTNNSFEKIYDSIEKKGPFVKGSWDQEVKRFTCRIFLNRCMDGQLNPYFLYKTSFNGTIKHSYPGPVNLGNGPAPKAQNVTILPAIRDGYFSLNLTITWQIIHVCRVDEPAFRIWLTHNGTSVFEPITKKFIGERKYSFNYTFRGLVPSQNYTVHIESFKITTDVNKTYVTKSFRTPRVFLINTTKTADSGFLTVTWPVDKLFLNRSLPVVLTINWCTPDGQRSPFSCKKTKPICTAIYDPSVATHGRVLSYEQNILQYAWYFNITNDTSRVNGRSLVTGTWDDVKKAFTCSMYLNTCSERSFKEGLKYEISFSGASFQGQYGNLKLTNYDVVKLKKGYAHYPKDINVTTTPSLADINSIDLIVKWRYRRECSTNPGRRVTIWITSNNKLEFNKKTLNYQEQYHDSNQNAWTWNEYVTYKETYKGLHPFKLYKLHITTILKYDKKYIESKGKYFWTPEGVPVASPSIEPIVDGTSTCVDDKRNVSVQWKYPPKEQTNGVIRSVELVYWNTDREDDKKKLILDNGTSTNLFGLKCYADYQVELRACIKGNQSCSGYSKAEEIKSVERISKPKMNIGYIFLWTSIGVALGCILVAFLACQYTYHKRRRKPLVRITEGSCSSYSVPYEVELAATGDYYRLQENDEL